MPDTNKAIVHLEGMYGGYHGQDPRAFDPDEECCTEKELEAHRAAVEAADNGTWRKGDHSGGCHHHAEDGVIAIVCTSSFGLGSYYVVMTEDGYFVRTASFEDMQRGGESWEETVDA